MSPGRTLQPSFSGDRFIVRLPRVPVLALVAQLALLAPAMSVDASPLPHADQMFQYAVIDQKLSEVLSALGDQIGVTVTVSDDVKGYIRGRLDPAPAQVMLDRLAAIYQFDWYFYGGTLYISDSSEAKSAMLRLPQANEDAFSATLKQLQIEDSRWPLKRSDTAEIVAVNGPPQYVKLVEQALTAVTNIPAAPEPNARVFRGGADD
jgi:type II secretory pathway component GspD/PulD (secretin)